jgi:hypothetical protein
MAGGVVQLYRLSHPDSQESEPLWNPEISNYLPCRHVGVTSAGNCLGSLPPTPTRFLHTIVLKLVPVRYFANWTSRPVTGITRAVARRVWTASTVPVFREHDTLHEHVTIRV